MKIQCSQCETIFLIDDSLISAKGVKAQCPRCGKQTIVQRPNEPHKSALPLSTSNRDSDQSNFSAAYTPPMSGSLQNSALPYSMSPPPSTPTHQGSNVPYSMSPPSPHPSTAYPYGTSSFLSNYAPPYAQGSVPTQGTPFAQGGVPTQGTPFAVQHGNADAPLYAQSSVYGDPSSEQSMNLDGVGNLRQAISLDPDLGTMDLPSSHQSQPLFSPEDKLHISSDIEDPLAEYTKSPSQGTDPSSGSVREALFNISANQAHLELQEQAEMKTHSLYGNRAVEIHDKISPPPVELAVEESAERIDPTWLMIRCKADGQEIGPIAIKEVRSLYIQGKINLDDEYAGRELKWQRIRDITKLRSMLQHTPQLVSGQSEKSDTTRYFSNFILGIVAFLILGTGGGAYYFFYVHLPQRVVNSKQKDLVHQAKPEELYLQKLSEWRVIHPKTKPNPKESENLNEIGQKLFVRDLAQTYKKAIPLFQKALIANPRNTNALAGLSLSNLWQRSVGKNSFGQIRSYSEILRQQSQARNSPLLQAVHSLYLLKQGEPDKALAQINELLQKTHQEAVIYLIGGDILLNQQQDLMRANQLLQRSLKLQPTLARARILLANHALTSSHFYRAEQFLNPLLNQYHPQALLLLAQLQMALGMLRQAHQTLQQLLRKHPNHIRGRLFSATLLYQFLRQPKMAYKQLSQLNLSEMDPSLRSEIILHRGYIELMEGQAKRALKLAEALIEQNKNDFPAQFLKAQILVLEKQYKKAESVMQLLNTRISADAPLQTFLALIQEHLGKTTEAMQLYTQIADQNTRYIWPRILLAASLLRQKKYTQAMLQLNRHALDIEPDVFQQQQTISRFYLVPQIWNDTLLFFQQAKTGDVAIVRAAAGMTAYHAGNVALAYKLLRHSLQIDARGLSANLYLAQYYYEINKLDVAKRHATNAYKIYNRHPIAAQILGWIAYKRQQYDLAMTYFTQVRQARPWFVSSIIGQALILAHRNEQKKAINMLRRLLTTYPHHSLLAHAMHQLKQ